MVVSLFIIFLLSRSTIGLNNGLALTPPMGWNPFNAFGCDTTEDDYGRNVYKVSQSSLIDAGYRYIVMDCGWQSNSRNAASGIQWNDTRYPSGIPALSDFVHAHYLSFGVYSTAGYYSCDLTGGLEHWIGSLGDEQVDAVTFAEWKADFLKYDNCFAAGQNDFLDFDPPMSEQSSFTAMKNALASTGREIVYSISEWGVQDPARWAGSVGNSWRISNNFGSPPSFEDLKRVINQLVPITQFAGPGGWNDLDLLQVGNSGLTEAEWATQFAFWAAAKSPLFVSTDLTTISDEALNILSNGRIIAVNQDSLGKPISFMRRYTDNYDVWAGPLANGLMVAVLVNWANEPQLLPFYLSDVGLASADITDLWTGAVLVHGSTQYNGSADAHGTLVYELSNIVQAAATQHTVYLANAPSNILAGGAVLRTLSGSTIVVGNIGNGGTLTFVDVDGGANGGTKLLSLSYVNADYTFYNTDCSNCRRAEVSVNGGTPVPVEMPLSGQSWDIMFQGYLLSLEGFVPGPHNNIMFANPNAWAPDMYGIGVQT